MTDVWRTPDPQPANTHLFARLRVEK